MALPNFIIAGFPKCGSTSLHYYLNAHPEIFMPKQKELAARMEKAGLKNVSFSNLSAGIAAIHTGMK